MRSCKMFTGLALAAMLALAPTAHAAVALFDFEAESTGTGLSSLVMSQSGLTVTITRPAQDTFGIEDLSGFGPASWGARTLEPFSGGTQGTGFLVNFSQPVTAVSIELGDFGADDDSATTEMRAFDALDAGGNFLTLDSTTWGAGNLFLGDSPLLLSVSASGILSIVFVGGSDTFPHSLYWDNLRVTFDQSRVPFPATLLLVGAGLLVAGARARRARRG